MSEQEAVFDDLEKGPFDESGHLLEKPIRDALGNIVGKVFDFIPIPAPPGSTAHLFRARYANPRFETIMNVVVKFGTDEPGSNPSKDTNPVQGRTYTGDPRGVALRNLPAYEAMDFTLLQNGHSEGDYGPLLHYIPRGNLPNAPGDVLIMEDVGLETFGDKLRVDNQEERSTRRIDFVSALHDIEAAYGDAGVETLYYPGHTEALLKEAYVKVFGKDGPPPGVRKTLSNELRALASYFSRHHIPVPLRYSYQTLRELRKHGDTIPLILKRILEGKMEIVPVSGKIPLRTFPLTLEEVGSTALDIALEMKNREPKREVLEIFEREYMKLVELERKWNPAAHMASVKRVRDLLATSLADLDEKAKKWKRDNKTRLLDASNVAMIRSKIGNTLRRIRRIQIENICSPYSSFCGFDLNLDNVVVRKEGRSEQMREFRTMIRRKIWEILRVSMPGPDMVHMIGTDGLATGVPSEPVSGRLVFFDMWPPEEHGMQGSPVIALSFMLYKGESGFPAQDMVFIRQWLRRVMEDAGEAVGLSDAQINCQRRLETARGRAYSALKFSQDPDPDWRKISGLIDQCCEEIADYEDPEILRIKSQHKREKWERYKKRQEKRRLKNEGKQQPG